MQFENITCPHCGLLCDDLSVAVNGLSLKLIDPKQSHCIKAFEDASFDNDSVTQPQVDGKPVSLEKATSRAAEILRSSSQPLISGLIADIQTCRNAVALAEKVGGVIDHANGASIRSSSAVMQRVGEVRATLAEVRNRADCVVVFGEQVFDRFPRLMDRILLPQKTLGTENSTNKKIFVLEPSIDETTRAVSEPNNVTKLFLNFPFIESIIYRLQEIVTKPVNAILEIDDATQALIDLYQIIQTSQYTTFIWSAADLNKQSAEQSIQAITESIKILMSNIRCVGLPLGGSKGEVTASQVATWQTGVPLPVAFMNGAPVHNPLLHDGMSMVENNEIDSLVWVATYSPGDLPPTTDSPTIIIGHPKIQADNASVFIPTGVPGIDTRGLACRTDHVATLPLQAIRHSSLPPASEVLNEIIRLL